MWRWAASCLMAVWLVGTGALADDRWPSTGGGGGSGFPGVSGSTGNEDTLSAIYALASIPPIPAGPIYYFSCDAAGDLGLGTAIGPGTREAPFLDWAQADAVAREGVTLRFDSKDTCFDYNTATPIDFSVSRVYGDWTPILRIDSTTVGDDALLTQGSAPTTAIIHIHDSVDTLRTAGGMIILQDIRVVGNTTAAFIVDNGVRIQALRVRCESGAGSAESCVRAAGGSKISYLNGSGFTVDSAFFDANSDWSSVTAIGRGLITMGTPGATASTGLIDLTSGAVNNITDGVPIHLTVIGHTLFMPSSNAGNKQIVRVGNTSGTSGEAWIELNMARVLLYGGDFGTSACFRVSEGAARRMVYRLYQVSMVNCDVGIETNFTADSPPVESGSNRTFKYGLFQLGAGVTRLLDISNGASTTAGEYHFSDSFVHQQGGAVANFIRWRRSAGTSETTTNVANFRSGLSGEGAPYETAVLADLFATGMSTVSTSLPTDDQFGGSGFRCTDTLGTGGTPCSTPATDAVGGTADGFCDDAATFECARLVETALCDSGLAGNAPEECFNALTASYTVPVWVWGGALGLEQDLESLQLTADNYGAR